MSTFAQINYLQPGDVVTIPITDLNVTEHYIVYGGKNIYNQDVYLENKIGHGVRWINDPLYAHITPRVNTIRRFNGNGFERNQAIQRGISLIGRKYDLVGFNCEHLANYVQYGKSFSNQVNNVGKTIAAVAGGLLFVAALAASVGGKRG